jgi:hypothetical protein
MKVVAMKRIKSPESPERKKSRKGIEDSEFFEFKIICPHGVQNESDGLEQNSTH